MSSRLVIALAAAAPLAACRPAPPPPAAPLRQPSFFALTPERLYTDAPVHEGISFVPVTERSIERRAGGVEITIRYPVVDLPDDDRERELAAAIAEAADLGRWIAEKGEGRAGEVVVACTTGVATTALVSVVCERMDASLPREAAARGEEVSAAPRVVARVFDVSSAPVRPLTWGQVLRPGVGVSDAVETALALARLAPHQRELWRDGACAAGEPAFSLEPWGLTVWPDASDDPCVPLALEGEALGAVLVPNGLVARSLRPGGPVEEAAAGEAAAD